MTINANLILTMEIGKKFYLSLDFHFQNWSNDCQYVTNNYHNVPSIDEFHSVRNRNFLLIVKEEKVGKFLLGKERQAEFVYQSNVPARSEKAATLPAEAGGPSHRPRAQGQGSQAGQKNEGVEDHHVARVLLNCRERGSPAHAVGHWDRDTGFLLSFHF